MDRRADGGIPSCALFAVCGWSCDCGRGAFELEVVAASYVGGGSEGSIVLVRL